jgi:hypothetical protein
MIRNFQGRKWVVWFWYRNDTPLVASFVISVGRDGKVAERSKVYWTWDW